jgi:hypothetical protein
MPKERMREVLESELSLDSVERKQREGWRPVAIEWEREAPDKPEPVRRREEIPYGARVSDDRFHLEENPDEMKVLTSMMDLIVRDKPFSQIAEQLNRQGFRTRGGAEWTQVSVFQMLPRVIELGPHVFRTEEWAHRRRAFEVA